MIYYVQKSNPLFGDESSDLITFKTESDIPDIVEELRKSSIQGFDTETTGFDPHTSDLLLFQVGGREHQYVFEAEFIFHPLIREFLQSDTLFIMHNAKFDLRFLMKHDIHVTRVFDTMLAEAVITAGYDDAATDKSLKGVTDKYLSKFRDKTIRGQINYLGKVPSVIKYAADDVVDLEDIMNAQMEFIKMHGLSRVMQLENEAVIVFAHMEFNGVKIDSSKWLDVAKDITVLKEQIATELDTIVLTDPVLSPVYKPKYIQMNAFNFVERELKINWKSPKQKLGVLKTLKLPIDDTAAATLAKYKGKHKLIGKLLEYAKYEKYESSFGPDVLKNINKVTGRIHYEVNQIVRTGRISVRNPNVNQIPGRTDLGKRMRSAFIAEPGNKIVGGDYSGFELRIIANFSEDPLWVETFKRDEDLHSILCSKVFDIPITDVKKPASFKPDIVYRDIAKTVNFGLAYGMSEHKLSSTIEIDKKKAKDIIDKFFSVVPKVKQFLVSLANNGKMRGYIKTAPPYSRIRWFPEWKSAVSTGDYKALGEIERQSMNTPKLNGRITLMA